MATLDTSSISAIRTSFLLLLVAQLSLITYPTYWEYVYPPNFLVDKSACQSYFLGICTRRVASACSTYTTLQTFDYIVVGAGPTGLSVASRLAKANTARTVLVIEAGNAPSVDTVCPQWYPFTFKLETSYQYVGEKKYFDINTRTETGADRYGLGYTKGLPYDYGKALGGTTVMNAMLFVCGATQDYDGWAAHAGDNSWAWGTGASTPDGMWSYLKRLTTMNDPNLSATCRNYYGSNGPLTVSDAGSTMEIISLLRDAAIESNYPVLEDVNCGGKIGYVNVHTTTKNREKNHAARALLSPLRTQKNLFVMRDTTVTKVNLAKSSTGVVTASGVTVTTNEASCPTFSIKASRDIVLSAGALNTPKILFHSGVGRAEDLTPFGITQKIDRPVGLNFHDHPFSLHFFRVNATEEECAGLVNQLLTFAGYALEYVDHRTGRFSYLGNMMYQIFRNTNDATVNPNSLPNNQWIPYLFDLRQLEFTEMMKVRFGIKPEFADQIIAINQNYKILMVYNIQLDQKSRGMVRLGGSDPSLPPKLYTNYLTDADDYDLQVHIDGVTKLKQFLSTSAVSSLASELIKISIPECDPLPYKSDAYWSCYFKYFLQNVWHPAGTATMGKVSDPTSVVDPTLQVIGVTGTPRLRVADSSIMPQVARGNIQCPCYLIGEKAADIIRASG